MPIVGQLLETAAKAEAAKNFRHAVTIYEQLLEALPPGAATARRCLSQLARLWLAAGRPERALPSARAALERSPAEPAALQLLGDCLSHEAAPEGGLREALSAYRRAAGGAERPPPELALAQARVLFRLGDEASKAAAAGLIMQVVDADQSDWQGLFQYAQVRLLPSPPPPHPPSAMRPCTGCGGHFGATACAQQLRRVRGRGLARAGGKRGWQGGRNDGCAPLLPSLSPLRIGGYLRCARRSL